MKKCIQLMTIRHITNLSQRIASHPEIQYNGNVNISQKGSAGRGTTPTTTTTGVWQIPNIRRRLCDQQLPTFSCWNCNEKSQPTDTFFCQKCGCIQNAPKDCDYFKLLSINNNFSLNVDELTKKFRQLQTLVHPDKFSSRQDQEQKNSLEWSSLINKAYKILLNPIERGEYLLKLQGLSLPEDNSALDKEFLLKMMERNEEVEDAEKDNILQLRENVLKDFEEKNLQLIDAFNRGNFEEARFILVQMKYLKSLEKNIKEKAVNLGVIKS